MVIKQLSLNMTVTDTQGLINLHNIQNYSMNIEANILELYKIYISICLDKLNTNVNSSCEIS